MMGTVWKYGDNVDTDAIIPARYLNVSTPEELARHCMEDIDSGFASAVQPGDIIVGGENFGCGSSREHAPLAIKGSGVACVVAKSFARIFYRNGINVGLPILECPEAVDETENGDRLTVDLRAGTITNERAGRTYQISPFPAFIMGIIQAGGLVPFMRERLGEQEARSRECEVEMVDKPRVLLYDTTLRDGTQGEGISLSVDDKLKITRLLDRLGVHYVEGGWPGSNPKDVEYFRRVRKLELEQARVAAFGSTCRVGSQPQEDTNIQALLEAETPVVTVVGKSSTLHVHDVLRTTLEENLRLIRESVAFLKAADLKEKFLREVIYDAEHFFDGYKADPGYALATLQAAVVGGADMLVLCDTNGGSMTWEIETIVREVQSAFPDAPLGIHAHNDGGIAAANSLAAVRAGATHVQGTMNGYGERCGNANLCTLIPNLELKMGIAVLPAGRLSHLTRVARAVASAANQPLHRQAAYVGRSVFAHKGGIHVAAMRRNLQSYQHIDPALVGNRSRVLVSELSGRGNLLSKAEEMGIAHQEIENLPRVLQMIKRLEHQGFTFEGAEASVEMLLVRSRPGYRPPFEMLDFTAVVEHREGRGIFAEATIKVRVGDQVFHTAAEGNGPVNALDAALRKALLPMYPHLAEFDLADYKVHILDGDHGTAATTRVLVDMQNKTRRWSTVGASTNIIEASWIALADAVEYGLMVAG